MSRIVFGVFLLLHALVHALWLVPKPDDPKYPFVLDNSRLLSGVPEPTLRTIGLALTATALLSFSLAGLGALGVTGLASVWRWAAVIGSLASVSLIVIYWSAYFIVGLALDVLILAAALAGWPQD